MPSFDWSISIGNVLSALIGVLTLVFSLGILWGRIHKKLESGNGGGGGNGNFESIFMAIGDGRREFREGIKNLREEVNEANARLRGDIQPFFMRIGIIEHRLRNVEKDKDEER